MNERKTQRILDSMKKYHGMKIRSGNDYCLNKEEGTFSVSLCVFTKIGEFNICLVFENKKPYQWINQREVDSVLSGVNQGDVLDFSEQEMDLSTWDLVERAVYPIIPKIMGDLIKEIEGSVDEVPVLLYPDEGLNRKYVRNYLYEKIQEQVKDW